LVILNIDKNWLFKSEKALDRLNDLYPYYWEYHNVLYPILSSHSRLIDLQLMFISYQLNSTIVHTLYYYFFPQMDNKGFRPLIGKIKQSDNIIKSESHVINKDLRELDKNFILSFLKFIDNAQNRDIKLVLVVSPSLIKTASSKNTSMDTMRMIADEQKIPIIDFSDDYRFNSNYDLFYDRGHLNYEGARIFSETLAKILKENDNNILKEFTR